MEHIDIILFAALAVFVLIRLWSVLGRRNDDEPQRPNPFATPASGEEDGVIVRPARARSPATPLLTAEGHAVASLAGGLDKIREKEPTFDEKAFLQGAKTAFAMIVGSFAKGDLSPVERFLGPAVLGPFQKVVAARKAAGHIHENRIEKIADAEIEAAHLEGEKAFLTVGFVSHQMNVTRDASGSVVAGAADKIEEVRDLWVFARDLKSDDPNWRLVETRS
ncbi:MAG: Tim44 domain-containing protein [Alphaproteobacteria bacterium]|nr:Tim44 domain-containing protein [Alphaproteobacteria bacterium]